jgi:D-3-phosphoglycerate dehydrogenase
VAFYDPFIEPGRGKAFGIKEYHTLEELISNSDIVSLHCPGKHVATKDKIPKSLLPFVSVSQSTGNAVIVDNHHLINEKILTELFKKNSYLINTARGSLVDLKALKKVLENGHLSGAGLVTFSHAYF